MKKPVLTPTCRLSFADLFTAKNDMNGKPGFRAELLFPKTIKMSALAEMKALYDATIKPEWIGAHPKPREFAKAFLDGNTKKQEGRHGNWMLRVQSGADFPPRLLMPNKSAAKPSDLFAGQFVRCVLSTFPWEHKNEKGNVISRGASFNLLTVQVVGGGEPFGDWVTDEEQDALLDAAPLSQEEGEDLLG